MLVTRGLVVLQIVVTCVLLIGSLLQVRSILNQQTIDYGYDTTAILSARMGLMDGDYPSNDARKLLYDFTIFGGVAIVLAAVGIYGVMSFAVSRRTQEFGVRMALGANAGRILSMVVRQGALQVAVGLIVGLGLSFGLAILAADGIRNTLFGVSGRDPLIYLAVAALVTIVSLAATLVPARRATRVDPMYVLRME